MTEMQTAIPDLTADCGGCNDSAVIESAARELYQTAALFVGDEGEATQLVEETVASIEVDPCADGESARTVANRDLIQRSLARLASLRSGEIHPSTTPDLGGCVQTDDLSAAGITQEQLEGLFTGKGRVHMRRWLDGLGPVERSVFVLRAVLGRSSAEAAHLLKQATGDPWTEVNVGGAYRAALCSLASSLIHSAA